MVIVRDHLGIFRQHAVADHAPASTPASAACRRWPGSTTALRAWREGRITHADVVTAMKWNIGQCLERFGEDDAMINESFDIIQAHGADLDRLLRRVAPVLAAPAAHAPGDVAGRVARARAALA